MSPGFVKAAIVAGAVGLVVWASSAGCEEVVPVKISPAAMPRGLGRWTSDFKSWTTSRWSR